MTKPQKMYCSFLVNGSKGILLQSGSEISNINIRTAHNLARPEDFLKVCGLAGLNLARIATMEDINNMVLLSLFQSYNFDSNGGILVGFDKNCFKGKCNGIYTSLDGSSQLNKLAIQFNSRLNAEFVVERNRAGLMLVGGLFKTVNLAES